MFSPEKKPKRIHMMTLGVLNLPRQPVLDWAFGHSLISCHVEHHLFPWLSDHMCLKVGKGWVTGWKGPPESGQWKPLGTFEPQVPSLASSKVTQEGQPGVQITAWVLEQSLLGFPVAV